MLHVQTENVNIDVQYITCLPDVHLVYNTFFCRLCFGIKVKKTQTKQLQTVNIYEIN